MRALKYKLLEYWRVAKTLGGQRVVATFVALILVPLRGRLFDRKPVRLTLTFENILFSLLARDGADIAMLRETFVDREYEIGQKISPLRIIDIGGYIGESSIFFACRYPHAQITVYEADSENYALLVENTKQFSQIKCIHAAVAPEDGERIFYRNITSPISSSLIARGKGDIGSTVHAISLRDIIRDLQPDLIKFDIEGSEYELLANTDTVVTVPALIGEAHYDLTGKSKEDFLALFPQHRSHERILNPHRAILTFVRM